jgi:hypothetical protein
MIFKYLSSPRNYTVLATLKFKDNLFHAIMLRFLVPSEISSVTWEKTKEIAGLWTDKKLWNYTDVNTTSLNRRGQSCNDMKRVCGASYILQDRKIEQFTREFSLFFKKMRIWLQGSSLGLLHLFQSLGTPLQQAIWPQEPWVCIALQIYGSEITHNHIRDP